MATQGNMNYFPGGFANGIVVRGVPLVQTNPGYVWWVSNSAALPTGGVTATSGQRIPLVGGSDGNKGTFNAPFATLQYAITQASAGDIIFIKPGHAESVIAAAGIVLSSAGVAVVGLGNGSQRPTFTFTTANTATITVTASNVTLSNLLFLGNFASIATCLSIANAQVAKELTVDSCEFRDVDASHGFINCVNVGTTANIADGLTFTNNKVYFKATAGALSQAVVTASIIDRLNVSGNYVVGAATSAQTGVLLGLGTSLNHTNVLLSKNMVVTPTTDSTNGSAVNGSGTMTGLAADNYVANLDNSASIWIPTSLGIMYVQNFSHITAAADKDALINPAAV